MGRAKGDVGAAAQIRRRRYNEEALRLELDRFTAGRDDWPTYAELRAAGRPDLAYAVSASGGSVRWARELGKTLGHRQTKTRRRWSDEDIETELRAFLGGAAVFPGHEEFIAAGRYELYMAVKKHGGVEHWRNRLGLPASIRTRWSDAELEAELAAFIRDRPDWPPRDEFRAASKQGLVLAVQRRGGVGVWAERLGKRLSARQLHNIGR